MESKGKISRAGHDSADFSAVLVKALAFVAIFFLTYTLFSAAALLSSDNFLADIIAELAFPASVVFYLIAVDRTPIGKIAEKLYIGRKSINVNAVAFGILVFLAIFLFELAIGILAQATNTQVNTNVGTIFGGAPVWFIFAAVTVVPISEEILFRAFLITKLSFVDRAISARGRMPWFAISVSAVIFALPHLAYNSTYGIEAIGALLFGILSGYAFVRTKSLYSSILAHAMVNAVAFIVMFIVATL
jgi:membrane protease YdiL (CAAX protease family)